jgi:hypothetical protein
MGKGNRKRTENAQKALTAAAPRKAQKREMPTWVGTVIVLSVVVALVAFALITSLNSRGTFNRMCTVAESENFEVTVPMMSYMLYNQYQSYLAQIQSYGSGNISIKGDSTGDALDKNKPLRDQTYSNKEGEGLVTWFDHFAKQAEDNVKQVLACCEAAHAAGVSLEETDYFYIEQQLASYELYAAQIGYSTNAYVGMMFGQGVRIKDVEKMMELTQLATKWTSQKSEEFYNGVTLDQINTYYTENQNKYDAFCDIIGYSFTASFTPDKNGDATKNAELAAEYAKDQERFAGYFNKMKEAKTREELNGILLGCLEDEEKYQLLKGKAEGYEPTAEDYTKISNAANEKLEHAYMANVADNDFSGSLAALDTWLFESKKEDEKTVYQRKPGETKEINDANNVVTDNAEAEKNYKAVSSTYGFYIFLDGMHRDTSPSVGHILFKNATYDGLTNSNKLTGVAKVLADRLFEENKNVSNYVLSAEAMAAELVEVMKEAGVLTEATREDGSTYYKINKEVFEAYGEYTEDSNVFYDGIARGVMVAPFEDWAYDTKRVVGEVSSEGIETDYGYHVMFFSGAAWESGIRDTLAGEANDAYLKDIQSGVSMTINAKYYDRITG